MFELYRPYCTYKHVYGTGESVVTCTPAFFARIAVLRWMLVKKRNESSGMISVFVPGAYVGYSANYRGNNGSELSPVPGFIVRIYAVNNFGIIARNPRVESSLFGAHMFGIFIITYRRGTEAIVVMSSLCSAEECWDAAKGFDRLGFACNVTQYIVATRNIPHICERVYPVSCSSSCNANSAPKKNCNILLYNLEDI